MAVLKIRNLSDVTLARLRLRAAKAGRSPEAEAREILSSVCLADDRASDALAVTLSLPYWVDELFGASKPIDVVEELIAERRLEAVHRCE